VAAGFDYCGIDTLFVLASGLLISGLGVQVPRGAPYLTWDYIDFRSFSCARFVRLLAPCSLACFSVGGARLSKPGPIH
jgi:hypothetical protein